MKSCATAAESAHVRARGVHLASIGILQWQCIGRRADHSCQGHLSDPNPPVNQPATRDVIWRHTGRSISPSAHSYQSQISPDVSPQEKKKKIISAEMHGS
jgi:hypothetical protein